jgi:HEAT repeat protein
MANAKLKEKLDQLARLKNNFIPGETVRLIRKDISNKNNLIVAGAADVLSANADKINADEKRILIPELIKSFNHFMVNPEKKDKSCLAKTACLRALRRLECQDDDVYVTGIRHIQMEPVFGGSVDTADDLRTEAVLALADFGGPDAFQEFAELLFDIERDGVKSKCVAVRAILASGNHFGEVLLRAKALAGGNPEVISECFSALVKLSPAKSVELISRYLHLDDEVVREGAALALGESRQPEVFSLLREERMGITDQEYDRVLLLAIALLRLDESFDYLLGLVDNGSIRTAGQVIEALEIYGNDSERMERLKEAVVERDSAELSGIFKRYFGYAPE